MEWVTCHNVREETWRRIMEYANTEFAYERIENIHGRASNSREKDNYRKQAEQIRSALVQAKEYFHVSTESGLYTKSNHLYYGMVSLNTAIMLLLGSGEKSLDYLRGDNKNMHHGLHFSTSGTSTSAKKGISILENTYITIMSNGFFRNWYEVMPKIENIYGLTITHLPNNANISNMAIIGVNKIDDFSDIKGDRYRILDLIKRIPDVALEISRYGVDSLCTRSDLKVDIGVDGNQTYVWRFHGAKDAKLMQALLEKFKIDASYNHYIETTISDNDTSGTVSVSANDGVRFEWPSARETLHNFTVSSVENYSVHELVDAYAIGYGLSMLSRYFPDLWISCLDSHCKSSKIIERVIDILVAKYPMMALSILGQDRIVISTERPYWHI